MDVLGVRKLQCFISDKSWGTVSTQASSHNEKKQFHNKTLCNISLAEHYVMTRAVWLGKKKAEKNKQKTNDALSISVLYKVLRFHQWCCAKT